MDIWGRFDHLDHGLSGSQYGKVWTKAQVCCLSFLVVLWPQTQAGCCPGPGVGCPSPCPTSDFMYAPGNKRQENAQLRGRMAGCPLSYRKGREHAVSTKVAVTRRKPRSSFLAYGAPQMAVVTASPPWLGCAPLCLSLRLTSSTQRQKHGWHCAFPILQC